MWKATLLSFAEFGIEKKHMTKIVERELNRTVRQKRAQLTAIREEIEDLLDYLQVLETRVRNAGKPRLTHEDVKKRYRMR